jgi:hypothetical protein
MTTTTKHAKTRYQQRGIDRFVVDFLIDYRETS